jgi:Glycosyl hydrolases family 16
MLSADFCAVELFVRIESTRHSYPEADVKWVNSFLVALFVPAAAYLAFDAFQTYNATLNIANYTLTFEDTFRLGVGFAQQYGYFEMRAKFPSGLGANWPAFWLLAQNHITSLESIPDVEIDVVEQYGNYNPTVDNETYHHWTSTPTQVRFATDVGDMTSAYHTYGVSIDPDWIIWYFDRKEQVRLRTPAEANTPMYVLVDLACSGLIKVSAQQDGMFTVTNARN